MPMAVAPPVSAAEAAQAERACRRICGSKRVALWQEAFLSQPRRARACALPPGAAAKPSGRRPPRGRLRRRSAAVGSSLVLGLAFLRRVVVVAFARRFFFRALLGGRAFGELAVFCGCSLRRLGLGLV